LTHGESTGVECTDILFGQPNSQATSAIEIKALYCWWTEVRRSRPDVYTESGWNAVHCVIDHVQDVNSLPIDGANTREQARASLMLLETQYSDEDEAMMIRLIKIRDCLWT
jgi:hypothetical protein